MKRAGFRLEFLLALLLALYWGMAVSVSPRVGLTADEPGHLTAGYSYWRFNDYRLNPENGTLPMRLGAMPLLAMDLNFPSLHSENWQRSSAVGVSDEFFFSLKNPVNAMVWPARAVIALVGAFTIWLIWRWARGLFGPAAGWLAVGLAIFCPTLLAHGGLATSDMAVTACFLAALSSVWQLLHRATWSRLVAAVIACGATFSAKMSGAVIVPLIIVLVLVRWSRGSPFVVAFARNRARWLRSRAAIMGATLGLMLVVAIGSLTILWASYGFRFEGFNRAVSPGRGYYFSWDVVLGREKIPWSDDSALAGFVQPHRAPAPGTMTEVISWLRERRLLPEAFLWGLAHTLKFAQERPAFFMGEFSKTGWPVFFPTAFFLKTPAPTLLVFAAGLGALLFFRSRFISSTPVSGVRWPRAWVYRAAPLLLFFAVYWLLAVNMSLNIGHRHILPIYPIVYVFASAAVLWCATAQRRIVTLGLVAMVALTAIESVLARPFYLSYFQPLFGGPARAYRYFVDSSLDWGQGLPDLARWQKEQHAAGDRAPLFLSYSGVDLPRRHGIDAVRFGDEHYDLEPRSYPARVRGGWFAISATHFQRIYLPVRGPWTQAHESLYLQIGQRLAAAPADPDAEMRARVARDARDYEMLQFGRLCHFLKDRTPDRFVGGSILLFRLADAEVNFALHAPLAEINRALSTTPMPAR